MLFPQGPLGTPALPLSPRKGLARGPASLLDQSLGPWPGSPGSVKNPGVWGLETEDPVLQVNWWLPRACPTGMWRVRMGLHGSRGDLCRDPRPSSWGWGLQRQLPASATLGAQQFYQVPSQPQVAGPVACPFGQKGACRPAGILALSSSRGILPEEAGQAAFQPVGLGLGSPQVLHKSGPSPLPSGWIPGAEEGTGLGWGAEEWGKAGEPHQSGVVRALSCEVCLGWRPVPRGLRGKD